MTDLEGLKGRNAIVTGAGAGIGRAIAIRLASLGINVALVARREAQLKETAALCEKFGTKIAVIPTDLLVEEQVKAAIETTAKELGGIDILVNNAGIVQSGPMWEVETEEFDRVMATNVRGPFLMCKYALPFLRQSDRAEIVNIASVVAHKGYPWQSIYAASKHAILGLSKSLANELYQEGIRVHVIAPGGVYTDLVAKVRPDLKPEDMLDVDDIADATEYFISHRTNAVCDEIRLHRANNAPF